MKRIFSAALFVIAHAACAAPFVPVADAIVLEHLSAQRADAELVALRARWSQQPNAARVAAPLARAYLQRARTQADPRYLGYAQAVLAPWSQQPEPPTEIQVLRASAAQSLHDFDAALRDLDAVLQRDPRHAQARFTRAAVHQARGDLAPARADCVRLAEVVPELYAQTCVAAVDALTGAAAQSYARVAALRTRLPPNDHDLAPWIDGLLAEFAQRSGDAPRAERHFQAALAATPNDAFLLTLYADFLLDQNRAREVVALLRDDTRVDGLLLRYALAQQRLNARETPELIATLTTRFAEARARGTALHLREEAMFALHLLNDAPRALRLAAENWSTQREPADARIALEAARATDDARLMDEVKSWIARNHVSDPILNRLTVAIPAFAPSTAGLG